MIGFVVKLLKGWKLSHVEGHWFGHYLLPLMQTS